ALTTSQNESPGAAWVITSMRMSLAFPVPELSVLLSALGLLLSLEPQLVSTSKPTAIPAVNNRRIFIDVLHSQPRIRGLVLLMTRGCGRSLGTCGGGSQVGALPRLVLVVRRARGAGRVERRDLRDRD